MDETTRPAGGAGNPAADEDPGEPIAALANLREPPAPGFLDLVRKRIYRKSLASQIVELAWYTPFLVLLEWILMAADLLSPGGKGRSRAE